MKEIYHKLFKIKNPDTGEYESVPALRGESAYQAALRLGLTTLTEEQWVKEYDTKRDQAIAAINTKQTTALNEIEAKRKSAIADADAAIADIGQKGVDTLASIPEDYTTLTDRVKTNEDVLRTKAKAIGKTVSGDMITVNDAEAQEALSLITHIEPVQEGEGDPSPDNVRPISGWDKVTAKRAGKNLYSGGDLNFVRVKVIEFDKPLPPGTYTLGTLTITDDIDETFSTVTALKADDTSMGSYYFERGQYGVMTLTLPEPCYALRFYASNNFANSNGDTCTWSDIMFVAGEATEYIPYQGQTLTADLPETVYGGTLDWGTGVLTVVPPLTFTGDEGWAMYELDSNYRQWYLNAFNIANQDVICSHYKSIKIADRWQEGNNNSCYLSVNAVCVRADGFATVTEWKQYLRDLYAAGTPLQMWYKNTNPTTIQLAPQQLETLKGTNNVWSSTGSTELTYAVATQNVISNAIENAMIGIPIEVETSGSMISVADGAARPAVQLVTHIEPVQEGSGEPSPDNVRAISGWSSVSISRTKKNLVNWKAIGSRTNGGITFTNNGDGTFNVSGETSSTSANTDRLTIYLQAGQYKISSGNENIIAQIRINRNGTVSNKQNTTFTIYGDETSLMVNLTVAKNTAVSGTVYPLLTTVNENDEFEPYNGQTLTAELPETVYGGSLDWNTGVLTVEKRKNQINKISSLHSQVKDGFICGRVAMEDMKPDSRRNGICDKLNPISAASSANSPSITFGADNNIIYCVLPTELAGTTKETLGAYLAENPLNVVYPLAEPYTIQLTPQQLETLKGSNNVWSDCGGTDITYIADTKLYIDNKFNELQNAILAQGTNI